MKVAEYAATWLVDHPRPAETTNRQAGYGIRPFVAACGHREMDSIAYAEARQFALGHRAAGRYARAMLEDARRDGLVTDNPFAGLRLPTEHGRRFVTALTPEQIANLESHAPMSLFGTAIRYAAYTGLRKGELLALVRDDLNYGTGTLSVTKSLRPDGTLGHPKHDRERVVVLPPGMVGSIRFRTADGRMFPWTHAQHRSLWDQTRGPAGFEGCWHELRHFCATWMLDRLVKKLGDEERAVRLVALQLGHSSTAITRRYLHPDPAALRDELREALA